MERTGGGTGAVHDQMVLPGSQGQHRVLRRIKAVRARQVAGWNNRARRANEAPLQPCRCIKHVKH